MAEQYIKRKTVVDILNSELDDLEPEALQGFPRTVLAQISLKKALDLIRNVPDSDTVEIVRCKECKNFENTICGWCRYFEKPITLDDYCSYGEREVNIEQV